VQLFDGQSGQAEAAISVVSRQRIVCVAGPRQRVPRPSSALHVVLGFPKGGKLEDITRMLTELGVSSLHIALTERSVPRPAGTAARMARLRRVALEACAQSGQASAPELGAPRPLLEIAASAPAAARRLVFWEDSSGPLRDAWSSGPAADVWTIVGPEGGLSKSEVHALTALGFCTAAAVIAALLLDRMGRLSSG
jgi:16S rRNA (uracil1498-N3)-methyltransferase